VTTKRWIYVVLICLNSAILGQPQSAPFKVKQELFDFSKPETLGLETAPGTETITIFCPNEDTNTFNHGVVLLPFKGYLYAQWQTSAKDEDAGDTQVYYCRSKDGKTWSSPKVLAPKWNGGIYTSGGWWANGDTLVAYINVWPVKFDEARGGFVQYKTSTDGSNWLAQKPLLNDQGKPVLGIFEQDPHALPDGRIICAVHEQPGLIITPYFTDDPLGIFGWTKGKMSNLPSKGTVSRELEPSWFYQDDGTVVMVFRDMAGSFRQLASQSKDRGKTWTQPVLTNMPDSRSKQSAGNLLDGTAFLVNNPSGNKSRIPLVVTLSKDGEIFDKAFLLCSGNNLQPRRFDGKYKNNGYSYPKSVIWGNYLYVAYAPNKEDVELTRVPLKSLSY
jgi:BNR repeat protein